MSDVTNSLLLLSEVVCNISIKDAQQISQEEFEHLMTKIKKYEEEIQIAIFMEAVNLLSYQIANDCISSYSRVLSHLENCLVEGLPEIEKKSGKESLSLSISHQMISTVQRLKQFIDRRFLYITPGKAALDQPTWREKLKLNISVSVIATLMSAFVRSAENVSTREETAIMRFIIQLFSSKKTSEIAFKSFQNHYRTPERAAIAKSIEILQAMIMWLKKV